jgi:predicted Holliday junction resolvase-like endonuclease
MIEFSRGKNMTILEMCLTIGLIVVSGVLLLVMSSTSPSPDLVSQLEAANRKVGETQAKFNDMNLHANIMHEKAEELQFKFDTLQHQKKSSEVLTGQLGEQLVGLLDGFDYDTKTMRFIGSPIDYVVFGQDSITFLEVKTGKSQTTKRQKHLKNLVESGKVEWKEARLTSKGLK